MRKTASILILCCATPVIGAQQIRVSVCNQGRLPEELVERSKEVTAVIFRAIDIDVLFANCEAEVVTEEAQSGSRYMIRLLSQRPPLASGQASFDAMGRAYVSAPGDGYLADIYYMAVQEMAKQHGTDEDELLGYLLAHEVGHLLLGPGHSSQGIMRARWTDADSTAVRQGGLKFTVAEQKRMKRWLVMEPSERRADKGTLHKRCGRRKSDRSGVEAMHPKQSCGL